MADRFYRSEALLKHSPEEIMMTESLLGQKLRELGKSQSHEALPFIFRGPCNFFRLWMLSRSSSDTEKKNNSRTPSSVNKDVAISCRLQISSGSF